MVDVGNKLIGRFADCLAGELGSDRALATPAPAPAGAVPASDEGGVSAQSQAAAATGLAESEAGGDPDSAAATCR